MWWMVTRMTLNGYALCPEQAITAREALTLYTINNAIVLGMERIAAPSKKASWRISWCCPRTYWACLRRRSATPGP